jgi:hypothetical protein
MEQEEDRPGNKLRKKQVKEIVSEGIKKRSGLGIDKLRKKQVKEFVSEGIRLSNIS